MLLMHYLDVRKKRSRNEFEEDIDVEFLKGILEDRKCTVFRSLTVSGFQGFRASGFQGRSVSGFQGFRVLGSLTSKP